MCTGTSSGSDPCQEAQRPQTMWALAPNHNVFKSDFTPVVHGMWRHGNYDPTHYHIGINLFETEAEALRAVLRHLRNTEAEVKRQADALEARLNALNAAQA